MDILVHEKLFEEESAVRLFRALTALESMIGAEALDAILIGFDAAASASAGVLSFGSEVLAAGHKICTSMKFHEVFRCRRARVRVHKARCAVFICFLFH